MPNIQVLTRERHQQRGWLARHNYTFAASDTCLPLVIDEIPQAMMSLPVAFLPTSQGMQPFAITGLQPGRNLLISPVGEWLYGYLPRACQHHPFCIATTSDGEQVLCIDEDSEDIVEITAGEAFFDQRGNLSSSVHERLKSLKNYVRQKQQTLAATNLLHEKQLLRPLTSGVTLNGSITRLEGLFQVCEERLRTLSQDDLIQIRDSGALAMTYCHHLSLQHWHKLEQLAEAHQRLLDTRSPPAAYLGESFDFSGFR